MGRYQLSQEKYLHPSFQVARKWIVEEIFLRPGEKLI